MASKQKLIDKYPLQPGARDLSLIHHPIAEGFISKPQTPAEWSKYKLTEEQIQFYNDNGYLTKVPVLTEEQVDRLKEDLESFSDPSTKPHPAQGLFYEFWSNESGDPKNVLLHALGHWRVTPHFHDLLWHPAILVASSQLIENRPVRFWHDQLFCKPPHYGGCVSWHQDFSYWIRTNPMAHLTVHIALDDQMVENGCLHYVPGSHKWTDKPLPVVDQHFGDMEAIKTILTPEQLENFKPTPMLLKKGEAAFHHPLTIHGSFANPSEFPRRACVLNFFADGVSSVTNEYLLDGVPVFPPGAKLEGQFFPLLFDPKSVF